MDQKYSLLETVTNTQKCCFEKNKTHTHTHTHSTDNTLKMLNNKTYKPMRITNNCPTSVLVVEMEDDVLQLFQIIYLLLFFNQSINNKNKQKSRQWHTT